jgi:hypothetical protein
MFLTFKVGSVSNQVEMNSKSSEALGKSTRKKRFEKTETKITFSPKFFFLLPTHFCGRSCKQFFSFIYFSINFKSSFLAFPQVI